MTDVLGMRFMERTDILEDSLFCWDLLMDTCYGARKIEIERYIGETLLLNHKVDKRYILVGGPGTGKSSLLMLINEIFLSDPFVFVVHDADVSKLDRYRSSITFAATNKEPSPLTLYDNDILIYTTGNRLPKNIYSAVMQTLMDRPCDIVRICLSRMYKEKDMLHD